MTDKPTITQADRDAAWFIRPDCFSKEEYDNWRLGVYDGSVCIQALAKHRESAVTELQAEVERLRDALEYYAENDHYDYGDAPCHIYVIDDHGRTARATLAQKEPVA